MTLKYHGRDPYAGGLIYTGSNGLRIILSGDREREEIGWHFSVSCADRNPTWEEQRDIRYELCPDDVYMVQILPPKAEYVNTHKFCFHWHEAGPKFFNLVTGRPTK